MQLLAHKTLAQIKRLGAVCATIVFRTHKRRWRKVAYGGRPEWDVRNQTLASFIPPASSVLDLGCGAQTMRGFLDPGCSYQPCDLVKSTPDVIVCDFNADVYPSLKEHYTHVVCSGVFEYIRKPQQFLSRISSFGNVVLLTYNPLLPKQSIIDRLANNWTNHYSKMELEQIFAKSGLEATVLDISQGGELIYRLRIKPTEEISREC